MDHKVPGVAVNQQRTEHFHCTPAQGGDPWRAGVGLGQLSPSLGGIHWQRMLPALVQPVPFLLGDVATACTEVLMLGRSCALSPRPSKQLDAHAR